MRVLLPLIAAAVPLILIPDFFFYFDLTPKVLVLLAGVAVGLLLWRVDWPTSGVARFAAVLLTAQLVWLAVATALSTHPALSLSGGSWRRFGWIEQSAVITFALMVISDISGRPERALVYLHAVAVTGVPIALYGILQHFGLDPLVSSTGYHAGEGPFTIVRPPSTLGHANYFATYLIFIAFAGAALTFDASQRFWRVLGGVTGLLALAAIVFSGGRAALGGVLIGVVVLSTRLPWSKTRWALAAVSICVLGFAGLALSPAGAALRNRIRWSMDEPLAGARPLLWTDSVRMAAAKPLAGYGPDTFRVEFPRYQSAALARIYPDFEHESPHNILLDSLAEQGVPGLLLFCAAVGLVVWHGYRSGAPLTVALLAALMAGLAAQQFSVLTIPTALMFYLNLALIAGLSTPSGRVGQVLPAWIRGALVCAALGLLVFCTRLGLADHSLAQARDAFARSDLNDAISRYEDSRRWNVPGASADLYVSREFAALFQRTRDVRIKLQAWTPAFQAATRAVSAAENRPAAFYNLAIFFATQNNAANVERCLRNSTFLAPNWFKPHWTLSRLLLEQRRLAGAEAEAQRAVDLDGGKDAEVVQTLADVRTRLASAGQ